MACSILSLPVEIGEQVIQNIDSTADLYALSLSCKAFMESARERIFANITFTLPFPNPLSGSVSSQETRLHELSKMVAQTKYIKFISICAKPVTEPSEIVFPPSMQSILAGWLPQMTRLEKLVIDDLELDDRLILAILDITSQRPLSLQLRRCPFPDPLLQIPSIPLQIPSLYIQNYFDSAFVDRPVDEYTATERQSIAFAKRLMFGARFSITTLKVDWNSPLSLTEMFGSIFLPSLRVFQWDSLLYTDDQLPIIMDGFLQRHSTITSISLARGQYGHIPFSFPSLTRTPPSLPNLQIAKTTSSLIRQLVSGRPVTNISLDCVRPSGFTVGVKALSHSTASIIKASLNFSEGDDTWEYVIESLAEATPFLQDLDLTTASPALNTDVCTNLCFPHIS